MNKAFLTFLLLGMLPGLLFAADSDNSVAALSADEPIKVTASRLVADTRLSAVTFYGDVQARQGEVVIYGDKLVIHYTEGEEREIDRAVFEGGVRIVQENRVATADKGIFYSRENRVLLTGNAVIHQDGNSVAGDEIEYRLDEEQSEVRSSDGSRVNAIFHPRGERQ